MKVAMAVVVHPAWNRARAHVERMMGPYVAELGAPRGFVYPNLGAYWQDADRYPYVIALGDQFVGFALVRRVNDAPNFELVEFYVVPECRNRGFGREAAARLFELHAGTWLVSVRADNAAARAFWASVLSGEPSVSAVELHEPPGTMYVFSSRGRRAD